MSVCIWNTGYKGLFQVLLLLLSAELECKWWIVWISEILFLTAAGWAESGSGRSWWKSCNGFFDTSPSRFIKVCLVVFGQSDDPTTELFVVFHLKLEIRISKVPVGIFNWIALSNWTLRLGNQSGPPGRMLPAPGQTDSITCKAWFRLDLCRALCKGPASLQSGALWVNRVVVSRWFPGSAGWWKQIKCRDVFPPGPRALLRCFFQVFVPPVHSDRFNNVPPGIYWYFWVLISMLWLLFLTLRWWLLFCHW